MATIDTARTASERGNARLVEALRAINEVSETESQAAAKAAEEAQIVVRFQAHRAQQIQSENAWVAQVLGGGTATAEPTPVQQQASTPAPQPAAPSPVPAPATPAPAPAHAPAVAASSEQASEESDSAEKTVPEWAWLALVLITLLVGVAIWASAGWLAGLFAIVTVSAAGGFGLWKWYQSKD